MSDVDDAKAIANSPGFGTGAAFRERKAQENECLANLPDPARMAPVVAATDPGSGWLVCSFGNSGDDGQDWHVVTDNVRGFGLADALFPEDARTDAIAVAALLNAWRMGLLVVRAAGVLE